VDMHNRAKNWGCPDTVDTNGLMPECMLLIEGNYSSLVNTIAANKVTSTCDQKQYSVPAVAGRVIYAAVGPLHNTRVQIFNV